MAVRTRGTKLVIDFRFYLPDGRRVRTVETEGNDTPQNRRRVDGKSKAIEYELKHGRFDYFRHFPHGAKAKYFERPVQITTLAEFWETWLSELVIERNTVRHYGNAGQQINGFMGHYFIEHVDEGQVRRFRKHLKDRGYKSTTINDYVATLCMCLRAAERQNLIAADPCKDLKALRVRRTDVDPFSVKELKKWLDFLKGKYPEWHDLVFVWSRTGLRPGEMYAVKWDQVDFLRGQLLIRETRQAWGEDTQTKTAYADRDLDLRPRVVEALKRQEARSRFKSEYVWINYLDRPLAQSHCQKMFRKLLASSGIRYRPPGQMRHTFATLHIAAGENISWVSKMLGHSTVRTTLNKYNRFIPNLTREDGSAFEAIFNGDKSQIGNNLVTASRNHLK